MAGENILSQTISATGKIGIKMTKELEEGAKEMCDFSKDSIEEKNERILSQSIFKNFMESMNWMIRQATNAYAHEISQKEQYIDKLK